jgi:hypothetical protein
VENRLRKSLVLAGVTRTMTRVNRCDSVATMYPDNPFTPAFRLLGSVVVLAAASSPVWADITVTVLGMANGGSKPVLVNKDIRVAVGPGTTERKILQLATDADGKVTIAGTDADEPLAFYCPPLHPSKKPKAYVNGAKVKAYCLTLVSKKQR